MKHTTRCAGALAAALLLCAALAAASPPPRLQLTLRGGLTLFPASGSEADYVAGENDFPVTPAYAAPLAGVGAAFFVAPSLALGLNVYAGLPARVELRDPSDGETVRLDSPMPLAALLAASHYIPLGKKLDLSLTLGLGGEYRLVDEGESISAGGSTIVVVAPAKPFSPLLQAGVGLRAMLSPALGLLLDLQAVYVFRDPGQFLLSPQLGLALRL